jgi:hypothetical protein
MNLEKGDRLFQGIDIVVDHVVTNSWLQQI